MLLIQISYVQIFEYLCLVGFQHSLPLSQCFMMRNELLREGHTLNTLNYSVLWTRGVHYLLKTTENASTKAKLKVEPLKFSRLIPLPVSLVNGPCYKIFPFSSHCMKFTCTHTPPPTLSFHSCTLIKFEGRVVSLYFHKPLSYTGPVLLQLSLGDL